jgi:hypothetical protein
VFLMQVEPQKEHAWLTALVGEWAFEGEAACAQGEAPARFEGTETMRALGGIWVIGEGRGEMPDGGPSQTLITLGYDPAKGTFVGSFVASMMTHLWIYHRGTLDEAGKVLTLESEGPDMFGGTGSLSYRDVLELDDAGQRLLRAFVQSPDGDWRSLMTATYRRIG